MRITFLIIAAAILSMSSMNAHADLVTNGGFEGAPDVASANPGSIVVLDGGVVATALEGFTLGGAGTITVHEGSFFSGAQAGSVPGPNAAFEGTQYLGFNGDGNNETSSISQDLTTEIGTEYIVEFSISGAFAAGHQLTASAGGVSVTETALLNEYSTHTFNFTATDALTTLTLENSLVITGGTDLLLDGVSVTAVAVPEPSSLMLLGGLGLGLITRRRKS